MDWNTGLNAIIAAANCGVLGILLKFAVDWSRVIERLDDLWYDYCKSKGIRFVPISRKRGDERG